MVLWFCASGVDHGLELTNCSVTAVYACAVAATALLSTNATRPLQVGGRSVRQHCDSVTAAQGSGYGHLLIFLASATPHSGHMCASGQAAACCFRLSTSL
jgi:hypothetical protein